jgi:hypothetical protein
MVIKKTVTSVFMVPTLGITRSDLHDNKFINAFSKDKDKEIDYEDVVFLLFKPKDLNMFKEFLDEEYERTRAIIDDYDYETGYVVVVYELNERFKSDFDLVKKSKYSQTSKAFQKLFPKKVHVDQESRTSNLSPIEDSIQFLIFNKSKRLVNFWENIIATQYLSSVDVEVWPFFDEEKETLDINKLYEQDKKSVRRKSRSD